MIASELYALAHGTRNAGPERCHWCGAAAERIWVHDDSQPELFRKHITTAKCPGHSYLCLGCLIYRRKRVTVSFLTEGFKDGQTAAHHSWWLTRTGAWSLRDQDHLPLYQHLLQPPLVFLLSLKTASCTRNELHLGTVNDCSHIKANTQLFFTLDNQRLSYTIYELDLALKQGSSGKEPGVHALLRFLGRPTKEAVKEPATRGRPPNLDGKITQRVVQS